LPDSACAPHTRPDVPGVRRLDDQLFLACGLSWGAGLIHVHAATDHVDGYVLFAVFFALLALAQFAWGIAICRSPARGLLGAGAVVSVLVVMLWAVSRTIGLPIGPEPWSPEPLGAIDSIASGDEAFLALLVILQLSAGSAGALLRRLRQVATAGGLGLVLLSSLALAVPHTH
jgi:hypothetical protein